MFFIVSNYENIKVLLIELSNCISITVETKVQLIFPMLVALLVIYSIDLVL